MSEKRKISVHFQPQLNEHGCMITEKDVDGKKRRYLRGVSSGLKEDAHRERVSQKCIDKFMEQANSKDILLYPDVHGIKQSDDIGILEKASVLPNGDWDTLYRLYDEDDGVGPVKLEKIDTLWKQANGFPPYKRKKQMGFSIEGIIPENGITMSAKGQTVLDDIDLDGVVLVTRPAYQDSVANAVYKALNELPPWRGAKTQKSIQSKLMEKLNDREIRDKYYSKKWDLSEALEQTIEEIMRDKQDMKAERLSIVFDEYKTAMVNLIMESQSLFHEEQLNDVVMHSVDAEKSKAKIYKGISQNLDSLRKLLFKEK